MVAPTDRLDIVTEAVFQLILANKVLLELADVYYGDQQKIPRTPTATVVASKKTRTDAGAPRRVRNDFEVIINLYISSVKDSSLELRDADRIAENLEAILHLDLTLDGLVYGSKVATVDSGYLNREGSKFRGNRLVFEAASLTTLPMRPGYNQ